MYVLHVAPLVRDNIGGETLSYFGTEDITEGSLITVPFRRRNVHALVLARESGETAKTKVRTAGFVLKKIGAQKPVSFLSPAFCAAVHEVADLSGATIGTVLSVCIPKVLLENATAISRFVSKEKKPRTDIVGEELVLGVPTVERFSTYKSFIREEFARNASVFLLVPTHVDLERAYTLLSKGIEAYTFAIHGSLSKKESAARITALMKTPHPVLIIATGGFLSLPRADIGTFIIEKESSPSYRGVVRPYVDFRMLARQLSKQKGTRTILADFPLRIDTFRRYRAGEYDEFSPPTLRTPVKAKYTLIDMRKKKRDVPNTPIAAMSSVKKEFVILSKALKTAVSAALERRLNIFLFVARRGLSPTTVCGDCGAALLCTHCGASVVLHKAEKGNVFLCHTCGLKKSAATNCPICNSWKLTPLGIGTERVFTETEKCFPDASIIRIDKEATKTSAAAGRAAALFYDTPGSILLGTEMALPYLDTLYHEPLGTSGVVSIDALLLLPLWNMSERLLSIVLKMHEVTEGPVIIQTRRPDYPLFSHLKQGALIDIYRDEIKEREALGYPPFNVLITLSAVGSISFVTAEMEKLKRLFDGYAFYSYAPSLSVGKGAYRMVGLLKVPRNAWPDKELLARIRSLPRHFSVVVDPENLL